MTIVVEEPEPSYKSEYGITVMVGGEELDLVDNGTETCGVMQAQKLTVTVPAGTTEVTFLNITDTVVYGQMYIYSGAHDWTEYASNVTEATINLEECGTSFCISDSANNWYHVTIVVEEPESEYELGDVNMDGVIDTQDANLVVSYYYGSEELTEEQLALADVDGNGIIDTQDANLIVSYYYGTIDAFPVEG